MLRERNRLFQAIHQCIDLCIVTLCFFCAYQTKVSFPGKLGGLITDYNYNLILLIALISYHLSLRLWKSYSPFRKIFFRNLVAILFKASLTGTAGIVFLSYLMHVEAVSRGLILLFTLYSFLGLLLFKGILFKLLTRTRAKNFNTRNILIIGTRQRAIDFIKVVLRRRESGYRILGCLDTIDQAELVGDRVYESVKIIGTMESFEGILKEETVDEVVFALPLHLVDDVKNYIYFAEKMGKNIRVLPDFQLFKIRYFPQTASTGIEDFLGMTTLALHSGPKSSYALLFKSFVDFTAASASLLILSPLLLLIALTIKCTSRGPVLFSQVRSGLNGRTFHVHKFRTMVENAEELKDKLMEENEVDGPVFKMKKDPRITWIGSFLRKTSLDELPQLFNVVKGEMSLVGPRPPLPSEVEQYKLWQRRKLSMKPGITCIWQVSGRNEVSFDQWMSMDLEYIDNWSPTLDAKLVLMTVKEVVAGGGR